MSSENRQMSSQLEQSESNKKSPSGKNGKKKEKTFQDQYNQLRNSRFKQQKLPACRPIPSFKSTIIIFLSFGFVFLALGLALYFLSKDLFETTIRYDNTPQCQGQKTCQVTLKLDKKLQQPIYFYYELDNFYQNHRLYVQSKDAEQLAGSVKSVGQLSLCDPIKKNSNLKVKKSIDGSDLKPEQAANPCGLIANSFFDDTYTMTTKSNKQIKIDQTGIAWTSDRDQRFKLPSSKDYVQKSMWMDVTNQHFIVWMRTAGLPDFRKLWGKIKQDLEPGEYIITIQNSKHKNVQNIHLLDYDVTGFDGKKKIAFAQTNFLGGKNLFLAYCYIAVGVLCIIFAIVFIVTYKYTKK